MAAFFLSSGVSLYVINHNNLTVDLGELGGDSGATVGSGNSSSSNPTWRIGAKNTTSTFAGAIVDSGVTSLIKIGTGTLILSGTSTYSGLTAISGGTLQYGDGGTNGTLPANNILNNATLAFNRSDAVGDRGIISGTGGLRQLGEGVLTLTNVHTYTGPTTIESGTLALAGNGSLAGSTNICISLDALFDVSGRGSGGMTLASGQTLGGNGAVKGNISIGSGATLAPGNSIGALTFSNALTLAAGSTNVFEVNSRPARHDQVNVLGNLVLGGTLIVTNIGGNPFAAGDSFQLFNAPSLSGTFGSLVLPPPGANLAWDTNGFALTGTLTVVSTAPPAFGPVTPLADGNFHLTFFGPTGQGYEIRACTNLSLQPVTLWDLLDSGIFGNAGMGFDDLSATNFTQRFYLIRLP
jgi:autotransporter-associated beta strand protein